MSTHSKWQQSLLIVEISSNDSIATVSYGTSINHAITNTDKHSSNHSATSTLTALEKQVSTLSKMVEKLQYNYHQKITRSGSRRRPQSRNRAPNSIGESFYYTRFGSARRKTATVVVNNSSQRRQSPC